MSKPSLLLVFAQCGRFIAESAARAGYRVRVADCFADSDTQAVAEDCVRLPPFSSLEEACLLQVLVSLSRNESCQLLCGTGIERYYPILSRLPPHIQLLGNSLQTIKMLRDPAHFFSLLDELAIPYPVTRFSPPPAANSALRKHLQTAGGSGVTSNTTVLQKGEFYQQFIIGQACSVCFLADGKQYRILGWNRQINQTGNFRLEQIWQQNQSPESHKQQLEPMLEKLVTATSLKGMNSLDYMIDKTGQIFLLEINPRISASTELLTARNWFQSHIDACQGQNLTWPKPHPERQPVRLLHYFYAESPQRVIDNPLWPPHCHDRPIAGSSISQGDPICTFILTGESEQSCLQHLYDCQQQVLKKCLRRA